MRPEILSRPQTAVVAVALYIVAVVNIPFWRNLFAAVAPSTPHDWTFLAAVFIALTAAASAVLFLLALPYLFKPIAAAILVVSAGAAYFMSEYGTVIDENMIRNVLETDPGEAHDLITWKLILFVSAVGLAPAVLLLRTPIHFEPLWRGIYVRSMSCAVALSIVTLAGTSFYQDFTSIFREHRELRLSLTPSNLVAGLERNLRKPLRPGPPENYGADAHRGETWAARTRKSVTVFVIGETARAANFSLNGYPRKTNPELEKVAGLINFPNTTSCGTDTAVSVPCIFSGYSSQDYRHDRADARENLLDIMSRAGFAVLWRDNQAGCKGVCRRVPNERVSDLKPPPALCPAGECLDEGLLHGLSEKLDHLDQDTVIVLHMMGSHGPAYYRRSPPEFRPFTPTCETNHLSRCSSAEITNTYDNSIVYTDHVLSQLIATLAAKPGLDAAMLYVSDHGESLGENGIYLHGMPYAIAPQYQTHVPMVLWMSEGFADSSGVDRNCMSARRTEPLSHENIFHSLLGVLDIRTDVYNTRLDMFAPCRSPDISAEHTRSAG